MPKQLVEVLDRSGHILERHVVELEGEDCVDAEYEEMALIHTERGGKVAKAKYVHLRARCVK